MSDHTTKSKPKNKIGSNYLIQFLKTQTFITG